jgi:hypothetical protein
MDADAAPERDVTRDGLGRHRPAAASERAQQVADTVDDHSGGLAGHRCLERARLRWLLLVQPAVHRAGDLCQRKFALAEAEVKRVEVRQAEFREDFGNGCAHAEAVELRRDLAALFALASSSLQEPAAHLARLRGEAR